MDPVKRFTLRLKLHKVEGTVVHHNALLKRTIPDSKLVQGYVLSNDGSACWHCWVQDSAGNRYDVASTLSALFEYSETLPDGFKEMQHENITSNKELYAVYTENQKTFWDQAPVSVKKFKV